MNTTELDVLTGDTAAEFDVLGELESLTEAQLAMIGGGQGMFALD